MATSDYRQKALEAKGEVCHFCGSTRDVEVHHLDGDRENEALENLSPLCGECHGLAHEGRPTEGRDAGETITYLLEVEVERWNAIKRTISYAQDVNETILRRAENAAPVGEGPDDG